MALDGEMLYVADTENTNQALILKTKRVYRRTGFSKISTRQRVDDGLRSPWDLSLIGRKSFTWR